MGWIIVTRNPRSKKLVIIHNDELDDFVEFGTESEANAVAMAIPVCEAWGFEAVEVNFPSGIRS
jgi:hypothetical protein